MTTVYKTELRTVRQREVPAEPQEAATFRRSRFRGSDAASQSTIDTGHYLEILETPPESMEEAAATDPEQESTVDDLDYENTEVPYEGLDASTVVNQGPPVPSVYDVLSH